MKILFITVLFVCSSAMVVNAQEKKQQIEQVLTALRQAILDGDRAKLDQLTDSELTYGHSLGKIENKQQFIEALASGQSDFSTMDISDQTIVIKKNTAIVRHKIAANVTDNGAMNAVKLAVMLVFVKDDKSWKLLGRQAIRLPN